MAKKQFKAESKKLLDLMINSIYTHKEIFLRELISNASDALDKLYYRSLESGDTGIKRNDFFIEIIPDRDKRTLTVRDNGIGMSRSELEDNLGTIARSGSLAFKQAAGKEAAADDRPAAKKAIDIIGQFGVGFYSAFMVSDLVSVTSRAYGADEANRWISSGADGYTMEAADKGSNGTEIVLHLKEDTDDEKYSRYLEEYTIRSLIRRYSDYIRYPIRMEVEKSRPAADGAKNEDGTPKYEKYSEVDTLNSMEPIWKKQKSKVKAEEYNEYYKSKFSDWEDPCRVIRTQVEGLSSFTALLFIPGHTPYDYYSKDYEKGLTLYSSGVMIMDRCQELLPDYFNFVRGLVDSQDLSLNISRETLQQDRQVKSIERNIEKKIRRDLEDFLKKDREGYLRFWNNFGRQLKFGLYDNFGMNREVLQDLVLFYSSTEKKPVTLSEYVSRMKEDQKYIYYASGESVEKIDMLPTTDYIRSKGFEILYLTDEIDEFVFQVLQNYKDKPFKSASADDAGEDQSDEEKKSIEKASSDNKELLSAIKDLLGDKVTEVRLSSRLGNAAVCLTTKGGISLEMEKVINAMPVDQHIKAERILELNPEHDVFKALQNAGAKGRDGRPRLKAYVHLLYDQALLISGLPIDDPVDFGEAIDKLIAGIR